MLYGYASKLILNESIEIENKILKASLISRAFGAARGSKSIMAKASALERGDGNRLAFLERGLDWGSGAGPARAYDC